MNIPLSPRLLACCKYVHQGDRIADVGCDHGYLGIYLLKSGTAQSVIASDINPQPLEKARINSRKFGVSNNISFCQSDGLKNIPHDFDTLVCAGMGADTIISILNDALWLKSKEYRIVLQCQTRSHLLRRYLSENGWKITDEIVLRDRRFLYTVMEISYSPDQSALSPGAIFLPSVMLNHPGSELSEYYSRIVKKIQTVVIARGESAPQELKDALAELIAIKKTNAEI